MSEMVYLFSTHQARPKYHDYGRIKKIDIARDADVTRCGLIMYDGQTRYDAILRRDHAELFAIPCAICFREAYE